MPGVLMPFLMAAVASLVLSVGGAFAALREPGLALKPLWAVLAFVGVGGAALVPQAPEQLYWFLGLAVPTVSFSAAAGSWDPEVMRALFPLGALVVWGRIYLHRNRQRSGASSVGPRRPKRDNRRPLTGQPAKRGYGH